ncbi:MAG: molybdopterin-synthase adenylyltransferase MoeB [Alphaproteobacteria bacterium]|nr:molybdopterin-synthase adenylyltransferase MoeB [Alphaproteobacteria bacterium]
MKFSNSQIERYARHIILPEVGGEGQSKLLEAKVLVIGAGGLGSPLLMYLAAAGVGTIGVVDFDAVSLSNLQRQIAHTTERVGQLKTASAQATVAALNPDVKFIAHSLKLTAANALPIIRDYDVVADGSDNFPTRFLLNDACFFSRRPLVSAAILGFDGQLATYKAYLAGDNPCYRCIFREAPPRGLIPSCSEGGVLGALAGTIGSLQATEIVKEVLGIGDSLSGHLVIYDALSTTFRKIKVRPDPDCPLCGRTPIIRDLSTHAIAAAES